MSAYQPHLKEMGGDGGIGFASEGFMKPCVAFVAGFAFQKNGAQVALFGQGVEGGAVERLFFLVEETEEIGSGGCGNSGKVPARCS